MTQEQAAEQIGVSITTWARWERGDQNVRPVYRLRLATRWQASVDEVERWVDGPQHAEETVAGMEAESFDPTGCSVEAACRLWRWEMDPSRRHLLMALPFMPAALGEWLLSWHYDPVLPLSAGHKAAGQDRLRVGMVDVERLLEAQQAFTQMDHQFGAGLVRPAVTDFMHTTLAPMLHGSYSQAVGSRLFGAAAQLSERAGWMAFDLGHHGQAQNQFNQGLRLAKQAGDDLNAAWILATMAHQACDLGQRRWAIRLAGAAADAGQRAQAPPRVMAALLVRQARALAVTDEHADLHSGHTRRLVSDLLTQADHDFAQGCTDRDPVWIAFFQESEFAAEAGYCWQHVGEHQRAADYAERALRGFGHRYVRSTLFNQVHAAQAYLDLGELDRSLTYAHPALAKAKDLASARPVAHLRRFAARLRPHRAVPQVRAFTDKLRAELA